MQRSTVMKARCSHAEKAVLVAIAKLERRDLSEVLRDLVREKAKELDLWPPQERAAA